MTNSTPPGARVDRARPGPPVRRPSPPGSQEPPPGCPGPACGPPRPPPAPPGRRARRGRYCPLRPHPRPRHLHLAAAEHHMPALVPVARRLPVSSGLALGPHDGVSLCCQHLLSDHHRRLHPHDCEPRPIHRGQISGRRCSSLRRWLNDERVQTRREPGGLASTLP